MKWTLYFEHWRRNVDRRHQGLIDNLWDLGEWNSNRKIKRLAVNIFHILSPYGKHTGWTFHLAQKIKDFEVLALEFGNLPKTAGAHILRNRKK